MNTHLTTHMQVLALTYPEFKAILESLIKGPINGEVLERYQAAPLYHNVILDFAAITQSYASNYNKINVTLNKLTMMIENISNIDYESLTDKQRDALPGLAGEIDTTTHHIREEIYPAVLSQSGSMKNQLQLQYDTSVKYINSMGENMKAALANLNSEFQTNVGFTEGLSILTWADIHHWFDRNPQIDKKAKEKILADQDTTQGFLRAIIAMEFLVYLYQVNPEGKSEAPTKLRDQILKAIYSTELPNSEFPTVAVQLGEFVKELESIDERVEVLKKELSSYPIKGLVLEDAAINDLERLTKTDDVFTKVNGEEGLL